MVICPDASRAQNSIAAVSAEGSTVWVLIRRLNFFSIPALSVKSSLRSSQWLDPCGVAAGPDRPADGVLPGAALSTSSCANAGSGWGMGRSWGVLPHARRLVLHKAGTGRQKVETHSPQPRPRGDLSGRVWRAADPAWTARRRSSAGSPRPSSTSYAAPRPACAPARPWPCRGRGAWRPERPRTSGRTSHGYGGSARWLPDTARAVPPASPARLIPPDQSISPDWNRRGVRPKWAPTVRESLNRAGSSTPAAYVRATSGPTPGTVISRLEAALALTRAAIC